ncbi:MAG: hypothetical protein V3V95_06135 [Thermodesulfobacteriota bacterium]
MSISSNKIEDIMRQYVRNIVPAKPEVKKPESEETKSANDTVAISDDGKKKMRERFQSDILNYLRNKY